MKFKIKILMVKKTFPAQLVFVCCLLSMQFYGCGVEMEPKTEKKNEQGTITDAMIKLAEDKNLFDLAALLKALKNNSEQIDVNKKDANGKAYHFLIDAVRLGNEDIVQILLKQGADVNAINRDNLSALHFAVDKGQESIVKHLLEHGADVNIPSNFFLETSLHVAAESGNPVIINFLLDKGADANALNRSGKTPLQIARNKKHREAVQCFLKRESEVNIACYAKEAPLHYAIVNNDLTLFQDLLQKGAKVNEPCYEGLTPLYYVIINNNTAFLQLLIKHGADINTPDQTGKIPLQWALGCSNLPMEIIECLLENGADINGKNGDGTRLLHFLLNHDLKIAKGLLQKAAKINAKCTIDKDDNKLLPFAIRMKDLSTVEYLLKNGAPVNAQYGTSSETLLHWTAEYNYLDIAEVLLKYNANVNALSVIDKAPLYLAIVKNNQEMIKLLLQNKADINAAPDSPYSPLLYAISDNDIALLQTLLAYHADVNQTDNLGRTPLHWAVIYNNTKIEIIDWLLQRGAKVGIEDHDKKSALQYAVHFGRKELVAYLLTKLTPTELEEYKARSAKAIEAEIEAECPVCFTEGALKKKEIHTCKRCKNSICIPCFQALVKRKCPLCRQAYQ